MLFRKYLVKNSFKGREVPESCKLLNDPVGNHVYCVTEGEHIDLRGLFNGLDKTERLVHIFTRAVDAVVRPNHKSELLHLLCGSDTDLICSANHTRKNANAVGEYDDSLGIGLPKSVSEVLFVYGADGVHCDGISGVRVHYYSVGGINRKTGDVAHHVRRELGGELAAVGPAPKKLCGGSVLCDTNDAEIVGWVAFVGDEASIKKNRKTYETILKDMTCDAVRITPEDLAEAEAEALAELETMNK